METIEEYAIGLISTFFHHENHYNQYSDCLQVGDISDIYNFAKNQKLENMYYDCLLRNGIAVDTIPKEWENLYVINQAQTIVQEHEKSRLAKAFIDAKIPFLPLKGWHLRNMYPQEDYRYMSDLDILIHREDRAKAMQLMHMLGYAGGGGAIGYDEGYHLPPYLHVELHYDIVGRDQKWYDYYQTIWDKAFLVKDSEFRLCWDDFYIHMIVNFAKDYFGKGTGIRPVLDLYLFLEKHEQDLNWKYVCAELSKLSLLEIDSQIKELAQQWFVEGNTCYKSEMGERLLNGNIYGTLQQFVNNYFEKKTGKVKIGFLRKPIYIINRAFPGYKEMCYRYPRLVKAPVLLPLYWIKRLVEKKKRICPTWKAVKKI